MASRRGKIGKLGDRLGSKENSMVQQTGQGSVARSSEIAKGRIANVGDKIEKEADTNEISKKYKKKNLKLQLRQGRITQEEYERQMAQLNEGSTAEFFQDKGELKVSYNGKTIGIRDFLKKSKVDTEMNAILGKLKKKMEEENFQGTLIQYIVKHFGDNKNPMDALKMGNRIVINKDVE